MKRTPIFAAAGAAILFAGSLVASPYWELHQLRDAVAGHDADAVSERVDFPALRESVKGQLAGAIAHDRPHAGANPFAAVGQAMALAFLGPMVDAIVSPAGVIAMVENGRIRLSRPDAHDEADAAGTDTRPRYAMSWRAWDEVVLASDRPDGGGFVFRRHGLWRWKLSGIELRHATS